MVKGVLPGQSAGLDTSDIRNRGGEEKLTPANKSAPKKTAFRYHSTAERERKGQGAPSQRSSKYALEAYPLYGGFELLSYKIIYYHVNGQTGGSLSGTPFDAGGALANLSF